MYRGGAWDLGPDRGLSECIASRAAAGLGGMDVRVVVRARTYWSVPRTRDFCLSAYVGEDARDGLCFTLKGRG